MTTRVAKTPVVEGRTFLPKKFLGDYGLIEKWPAMSANITRDPVIIAGPGIPSGTLVDDMVELIDVFPTLLELADVPDTTHRHYGRSLVPTLISGATHRAYAFTEGGFTIEEEPQLESPAFPYDIKGELQHTNPRKVGKAIAVRDRRYTYVERLYESNELYDRDTDPGERVNLIGRADYAAEEARLRGQLMRWLIETADVIPYTEDPRSPAVDLPAPGDSQTRDLGRCELDRGAVAQGRSQRSADQVAARHA